MGFLVVVRIERGNEVAKKPPIRPYPIGERYKPCDEVYEKRFGQTNISSAASPKASGNQRRNASIIVAVSTRQLYCGRSGQSLKEACRSSVIGRPWWEKLAKINGETPSPHREIACVMS